MGISKKDLMESYYIEEISEVFYEYLNLGKEEDNEVEYVGFSDFFGI